jgi:hypothetical protein
VSEELIKRLRYTEEHGIFTAHDNGMLALPGEAADTIEAQAAEIKRLREALRGMVEYSMSCERWQDDHPEYVAAARAALRETE